MADTNKHILFVSLLLFVAVVAHGESLNHEHETDPVVDNNVTVTETRSRQRNGRGGQKRSQNIKDDAIANALAMFGINDTIFRPGQIICPDSNLSSPYKRNRVVIGVVGCFLDPLISQYTLQQRLVLQKHHDDGEFNCSDAINLAGYYPSIPGLTL